MLLHQIVKKGVLISCRTRVSPVSPFPRVCSRASINTPISQVKNGLIISHKGRLFAITNYSHHSQGRQGAHYKLDLRDIRNGGKAFERFNSGQQINVVELEERKLQYLYVDAEEQLHFVDPESFAEHSFPAHLLDADPKVIPFLSDGMLLRVHYHEGSPILIKVPEKGVYKVAETAPPSGGGGGGSASGSDGKGTDFKAATLDNGVVVKVPEWIDVGDAIQLDILALKYLGRGQLEG